MPPVATPARPRAASRPAATAKKAATTSAKPVSQLTLSSKNYSSWSLRGWLMARFAGRRSPALNCAL